jgi:hypothetical protein
MATYWRVKSSNKSTFDIYTALEASKILAREPRDYNGGNLGRSFDHQLSVFVQFRRQR